jgi:hypothetical protein
MTPDEIKKLKAGNRLMGPSNHKAEVIRRTPNGVELLWVDGETTFYSLSDPKLQNLTYHGPRIIGEPWLQMKASARRGNTRLQSGQRGKRR